MRFLHTADWHIGKTLNDFSLLDDQLATFKQIEAIAKDQQVDAIVIAGDLYDRSVPNEAAVFLPPTADFFYGQWPLFLPSRRLSSCTA